ncbi:MAG: MBL fold metallo-hydrolase [Candidatus Eremiobacterota bacterium]
MKKIADGFVILKRYGELKNACWILYHNGEGAIVEMPPFKRREKPPYKKAKRFFQRFKIFPKYAFLSHTHWDHSNSLTLFRLEFPRTRFVAHTSFYKDPYMQFFIKNYKSTNGHNGLFDEVFDGFCWAGELGGEPIFLIHAPKHSPSDLMVIFRGAMITGDWNIGDIRDCNNLVPVRQKLVSINNLEEIVSHLDYNIHMLFSGHGDCLFYSADFYRIMEETKIDHNGAQIQLPARFTTADELGEAYYYG